MTPRYIVFCGSNYYPCGGWEDYHSSHQTIDEAKAEINRWFREDVGSWFVGYWAHIADLADGKIVCVAEPKDEKQVDLKGTDQ